MNEDYVSYELAVKLKSCGFNEPCDHYYENGGTDILYTRCRYYNESGSYHSAPTLWHAHKWLREKKGITINAIAHEGGRYHTERIILPNCMIPESRDWYVETTTPMVYSYEQALSEGIKSALELIKKVE